MIYDHAGGVTNMIIGERYVVATFTYLHVNVYTSILEFYQN